MIFFQFLFFSLSLFKLETFGKRHFVTFMLFLGMANAYVMRTNMSVAIVAMVNHTAVDADKIEKFDNECPVDGNVSATVSFNYSFYHSLIYLRIRLTNV